MKVKTLSLILIPLPALVFLGFHFWSRQDANFLLLHNDPDWLYLFNSLNIYLHQAPAYTHHPGTTVQLFGAVGIWLYRNIFSSSITNSIKIDVLSQPERYVGFLGSFFVCLQGLCSAWLQYALWRAEKYWWMLLPLSLPFASTDMLAAIGRVNPEFFLMMAGTCLTASLISYFHAMEKDKAISSHAVAIGACLGFAMATKVTALPWLLSLCLLNGKKDRLLAASALLGSFFLCTIPIWPQLPIALEWLVRLFQHQGIYGRGELGITSAALLLENFDALTKNQPIFFCALFLFVAAVFLGKINKYLAVSIGIFLVNLLMVAKHPGVGTKGERYLIASYLWILTLPLYPFGEPRRFFSRNQFVVAYCIIFCTGIFWTWNYQSIRRVEDRRIIAGTEDVMRLVNSKYTGCYVIAHAGSPLDFWALSFANSFVKDAYAEDLRNLYPKRWIYEEHADALQHFDKAVAWAELQKILKRGECVIFLAGVGLRKLDGPMYSRFVLEEEAGVGFSFPYIYRVRGVRAD